MSAPVLVVLAGPNGSGKSTLAQRVLVPVTGLPFVNADEIAHVAWPGDEEAHAYEASARASELRDRMLHGRASFVTETVFSHPSKNVLLERAASLGYLVQLHVVMVPVDVSVARVAERVGLGGHSVPERKIRERWERLWPLVVRAIRFSDRATIYDNGSASAAFRVVAEYEHGALVEESTWPAWSPAVVRETRC